MTKTAKKIVTKSIKIVDLTEEQVAALNRRHPAWVYWNCPGVLDDSDDQYDIDDEAERRPVWMAKNHPLYMAYHDPRYMDTHRPKYMAWFRAREVPAKLVEFLIKMKLVK